MKHTLTLQSRVGDGWTFRAEGAAEPDACVWFWVEAGPMAGILKLTAEQARTLAGNLSAAVADAHRLSVAPVAIPVGEVSEA
jgi:hypothetical protein